MKKIYAFVSACLITNIMMAQSVTSITPNHGHSWSTVTAQIVCGFALIPGNTYTVDFVYDVTGSATQTDFNASQVVVVNNNTLSITVQIPYDQFGGALSGTYDIVVTDVNGNQHTGTKLFTVSNLPAGISDISADGMQVYPNPAKDQLHVNAGSQGKLSEVSLTAIDGTVVLRQPADSNTQATLHVGQLAEGIYILTTTSASGATTNRKVTIK